MSTTIDNKSGVNCISLVMCGGAKLVALDLSNVGHRMRVSCPMHRRIYPNWRHEDVAYLDDRRRWSCAHAQRARSLCSHLQHAKKWELENGMIPHPYGRGKNSLRSAIETANEHRVRGPLVAPTCRTLLRHIPDCRKSVNFIMQHDIAKSSGEITM